MRTAEFDRTTVLRAAMQLFIQSGYRKTSMQALKQATGLHPGSLYCAFGNKEGLLLAALQQYNDDRARESNAIFAEVSAWQGLNNYLDQIAQECLSGDALQGCLTYKAMNELAEQLPEVTHLLKSQFSHWHDTLSSVMRSAQKAGDIDSNRTPEELAHFLIMGVYGLRAYANCQPDPKVIDSLVNQLLCGLKSQQ